MPVPPGAIDNPRVSMLMMSPARPLPTAPHRPESNRPITGEADAPRAQALFDASSAQIRGVIGQSATVGANAASMGAPGILGFAHQQKSEVASLALDAIGNVGRFIDRRA